MQDTENKIAVYDLSRYRKARIVTKMVNDSKSQKTADTPSASSPSSFQPEQHEISARELKNKLDRHAPLVLLDVREPIEYQIVHLAGSVLIPLNELPQQVNRLNPKLETVAYCHHGMRSLYAAAYLHQIGFQNVKSLAGGIDQWSVKIDPALSRY